MGLNEVYEQALEILVGSDMETYEALEEVSSLANIEEFETFIEAHEVVQCSMCNTWQYSFELDYCCSDNYG